MAPPKDIISKGSVKRFKWKYNKFCVLEFKTHAFGHILSENELFTEEEFQFMKAKFSLYDNEENEIVQDSCITQFDQRPNLMNFHSNYPECGNPCSRNEYKFVCREHQVCKWLNMKIFVGKLIKNYILFLLELLFALHNLC